MVCFFFSFSGASMSSLLEKDAGFCSGSSEHEDDHSHDGLHSPTDASEDSVEVKFTPISKNKRKSSEPSRIVPDAELGPLKKRFRYEEMKKELIDSTMIKTEQSHLNSHFRPWAPSTITSLECDTTNPADYQIRHPGVTTLHRAINSHHNQEEQDQPLSLVAKKPSASVTSPKVSRTKSKLSDANLIPYANPLETLIKKSQMDGFHTVTHTIANIPQQASSSAASTSSQGTTKQCSQRNYKNMTRERRIEANARERTRVHTISAAYDTLRKSIPAYSNTQKLSKLSVLRVACSYILTLSRMTGEDFSEDQSEPNIGDCIDAVTRTIQTEGKLRKKKDE